MESFGLKNFQKEQLLTITKSFNSRLSTIKDLRLKDQQKDVPTEEGHFSWIFQLWGIHTNEVRRCCGLQTYLYLNFVKQSAYFFAFVAVVSCGTLLPTYSLGDTNEHQLSNKLEKYTLLNALGKPHKMWVVFTITVVIGLGGHLFVYFFERLAQTKREQYAD